MITNDITITPIMRELMFQCMDGDQRLAPIMHNFYQFVRCTDILRWLVQNNLRGMTLFNWLKIEFQGSPLEMVKFILGRIEGQKEKKCAILYGKDFKPV